jgi:hypothetical protein
MSEKKGGKKRLLQRERSGANASYTHREMLWHRGKVLRAPEEKFFFLS